MKIKLIYPLFSIFLFISSCDLHNQDEEDFYDAYCFDNSVQLWGEYYQIDSTEILILDNVDGNIPKQIGCLNQLINLDLSGNDLNGQIPDEIGYLVNLQNLNLSDNELESEIPTTIGDLINLKNLKLSYNQLSGAIPANIGNLENLVELRISNNSLSEAIPPQITNLVNLYIIDLKENQFSTIPNEICNLNIKFLNWGNFTIMGNKVCPPYPDCISILDISTQDTSYCTD